MANVLTLQKLEEGQSNLIFKATGDLDTSDQAYTIIVDPTTFSDTASPPTTLGCSSLTGDGSTHPTRVRIRAIDHNIEDGLAVQLFWDVDGTQANAKRVESLEGRHYFDYRHVGDISNNATTPTGKLGLSTQGWASTLTLSYSLIIELIKY